MEKGIIKELIKGKRNRPYLIASNISNEKIFNYS
jgi:hypothetical protein